jgi:hypothetical protein
MRTGVETNDGGGIPGIIYTKEGDGKRELSGLVTGPGGGSLSHNPQRLAGAVISIDCGKRARIEA